MNSNFVISETEKLREPDTIYNQPDSVVIAVDLGCAFTKVSYWNFEDGCSTIIKMNGAESIPTAIAYSVSFVPILMMIESKPFCCWTGSNQTTSNDAQTSHSSFPVAL